MPRDTADIQPLETAQGQVGQDLKQPGTMEGVPAHGSSRAERELEVPSNPNHLEPVVLRP